MSFRVFAAGDLPHPHLVCALLETLEEFLEGGQVPLPKISGLAGPDVSDRSVLCEKGWFSPIWLNALVVHFGFGCALTGKLCWSLDLSDDGLERPRTGVDYPLPG